LNFIAGYFIPAITKYIDCFMAESDSQKHNRNK